jgi:quinol monooxygenase YgiN
MSISVLVSIAGVLVAAVGTGLLGGRCIRSPSPSFIAWTIGMSALTVALLGQSIGFATGFGAVTFRVIQITAQLMTPVVLAWGLVELVARGTAARFGARLAVAALIVVIGVILATDPLAAKPFGRTWPSAAVHYQIIPHYALIALHLTVVLAALAAVALCAARGRDRGARGPAPGRLVPGAAAIGAATVLAVALRFTLPAGAAYPALSALSAGLVWFGVTRLDGLVPGVSRAGAPGRYGAAEPDSRAGGRGQPGFPAGRTGGPGFSAASVPGAPNGDARPFYDPGAPGAEPATGAIERPGAALRRPPASREPRPGTPGTEIVRPAPRPHGLIAIYTLLEDKVAAFDRIADEAAEQVRANEPDALVYVIHTVPEAPMQRIFYEIYRDRAAYVLHEHQPYIKRFVTARRPYVLATNVIELRLKYAKISPLVQDDTQAPSPADAPPDWHDRRPSGGARTGNDDRAAGGRPGPGQLPPPAPPRPYGGI